MARTIQSPGVEIKEVDLSLRPDLPVGTNVFVAGFAHQGPTDELLTVSSVSEFEQIYGTPRNAAERYFYHTCKQVLNSSANLTVTRLAYGENTSGGNLGEKFSVQVFPVYPRPTVASLQALSATDKTAFDTISAAFGSEDLSAIYADTAGSEAVSTEVTTNGWEATDADAYYFGAPSNIELSDDEYRKILTNSIQLSSKLGKRDTFETYDDMKDAGMMVLNTKRLATNEKFEGYYVGLADNTNLNPATDFDAHRAIKTINKNTGSVATPAEYITMPADRTTFDMTASAEGVQGSVSEVVENIPTFDINKAEFDDTLILSVFKIRQSTLEPDTTKLDYVLSEGTIGSLNFYREQFPVGGGTPTSFFIESETAASSFLKVHVNKAISKDSGSWVDDNNNPERIVRVLSQKAVDSEERYLNAAEKTEHEKFLTALEGDIAASVHNADNLYVHGSFKEAVAESPKPGAIPGKLDRVFELADNFDLYPIDITLEAGLGTIFVGSSAGNGSFDDECPLVAPADGGKYEGFDITELHESKTIDSPGNVLTYYRNVQNTFVNFSQFKRKDNLFISDPLRYIFVQGENQKTLSDTNRDHTKNFSQHIYWPLRHLYATINTSYAATYGTWAKTYDKVLNKNVWVPFSGYAAKLMADTDSNFQPWFAPAGFTRGLVSGATDIGIYPKQKQRDQLYKIGINPVAFFPNDGFAVFGQKTLQAKPSAFDRINVRRLFLYLEKAVRNTIKYFVFEPNTLFTRTQVVNVLTPIFELAKQTEGLYDYLIVCDDRNNNADVIDRNELVVDIYLKPVRAAEFVLVNFYATRTGQDFSELVG